MRGKPNPKLKAKCVRLRVEKRMSLREIHQLTGVSKGSLSVWLRPHPLTEDEKENRKKKRKVRSDRKYRGDESDLHRLSPKDGHTRLEKSKIAETAVLLRLVLFHFVPFGSVFDGDKTDWLVEVPSTGKVRKVQVRWAKKSSKAVLPYIKLTCAEGSSKTRRYKKGEFDFIVAYDFYTDTSYVWSWEDVKHLKASVTVHPDAAERWDKLLV